jgi:hypothetical protein
MDYWLALLTAEGEDVVEEHIFACDACGDRLRRVIALGDTLRTLARSGALTVVVTDRLLEQAANAGARVREYAPPPGGSVQCTVSADDDLLVARLALDVNTASRVDLSWCSAQGIEQQRMTDIPIVPGADAVLCQQSVIWAKASPSASMTARLFEVADDGGERLLGEYTFHHTRTIPGPPGWSPR